MNEIDRESFEYGKKEYNISVQDGKYQKSWERCIKWAVEHEFFAIGKRKREPIYTYILGGILVGRGYALSLATDDTEDLDRYIYLILTGIEPPDAEMIIRQRAEDIAEIRTKEGKNLTRLECIARIIAKDKHFKDNLGEERLDRLLTEFVLFYEEKIEVAKRAGEILKEDSYEEEVEFGYVVHRRPISLLNQLIRKLKNETGIYMMLEIKDRPRGRQMDEIEDDWWAEYVTCGLLEWGLPRIDEKVIVRARGKVSKSRLKGAVHIIRDLLRDCVLKDGVTPYVDEKKCVEPQAHFNNLLLRIDNLKFPSKRTSGSGEILRDEGGNDFHFYGNDKGEQSREKKVIAHMIETAADVLRQENAVVHSFIIVNDKAFVEQLSAVSGARLGELEKNIRKIFGHKRANHIHICKSYEEAKAILEKIKGADWRNTFFYVDSRIKASGEQAVFDRFIKMVLRTENDGSILMAAPVSGYTAYSEVYADLIRNIQNLRADKQSGDVIKAEVKQLTGAMAKIKKDMIKIDENLRETEDNTDAFISGIIGLADTGGRESDIAEYIKKYQNQHTWSLPYVKEINWEEFCERFKAEAKILRSL